jgi:hypothetical protein
MQCEIRFLLSKLSLLGGRNDYDHAQLSLDHLSLVVAQTLVAWHGAGGMRIVRVSRVGISISHCAVYR